MNGSEATRRGLDTAGRVGTVFVPTRQPVFVAITPAADSVPLGRARLLVPARETGQRVGTPGVPTLPDASR